ncbi:MAG: 2-hydroxyacid dehydrogenase [bacterium]
MKALITAAFDDEGLAALRTRMEIRYESYRETGKLYFDAAELAAKVRREGADVLIVEADLVHEEVFEACDLKIVGCCRADPLNVSREAASRRGIPILFAPGRNADAVADLALGFMLCLARNIVTVHERLRTGRIRFESMQDVTDVFNRYGGFELGGATVGIVGMGAVGKRVARRLAAFGCAILVYDPYVPEEAVRELGAEPVALPSLLERSDIVSLHAPLTAETRGLIDAEALARMKPTAFLINTARSGLADEKALLDALARKRIRGAALDVFDEEPLQPENPFLLQDNVICTPHLGGASRDVIRRQSEMIAGDVLRWLRGERPRHIWNPEVLGPPDERVP